SFAPTVRAYACALASAEPAPAALSRKNRRRSTRGSCIGQTLRRLTQRRLCTNSQAPSRRILDRKRWRNALAHGQALAPREPEEISRLVRCGLVAAGIRLPSRPAFARPRVGT